MKAPLDPSVDTGMRGRLRLLRSPVATLVVLTTAASALNYASSLVFSRVLTPASFGDYTALLALTVIVAVPTGAAQTVIAARIAELRAREDAGGIRFFVRHALAHIAAVSLVLGVLYTACIPLLVELLDLQATGPAIALIPLLMLSFFTPAAFGLLQGFERFAALGWVLLLIAASRIVFGVPWALADAGGAGGPLGGQAVGNAIALGIIAGLLGGSVLVGSGTGAARSGVRRRPDRRSLEVGGAFVAFAVLSNADVLLAKLFLSPTAGGHYAALATLEKVMLFLPGAVALAIVPEAARARLDDVGSRDVLRRGVLWVLGSSLIVAIPPLVAPSLTLRLMFGAEYTDAAGGVRPIIVAGAGLALLYLLIVFTVTLQERRLRLLLIGGMLGQVAAIAAVHGSVAAVALAQMVVVLALLAANEAWGYPIVRSAPAPAAQPGRIEVRAEQALAWLRGTARQPRARTFGLLVVLAAAIYGPYVAKGGFVHDDWFIAVSYQLGGRGLLDQLKIGLDSAGSHPISGLYTGATHWAFGLDATAHLIFLAVLGVATSLALYGVLRRVRIGWPLATAGAALLLAFPASDAGRLWIAGGGAQFAVLLLLAGVFLALGALDHSGWLGIARHVPATALYVASLLTYDVAAVVVAGIVLVYRLRVSWRRAVVPWVLDLAALIAALLYVRGGSSKQIDASGDGVFDRVRPVFETALQVFASNGTSIGPVSGPLRVSETLARLAFVAGLAVLGAGLWQARRKTAGWELLRASALLGLYGVLVVIAGTAVLLLVQGYLPLSDGIGNRVNVLSAIGYVCATLGMLVTLGLLLGARRDPRAATGVVVLAALLIGSLYVLRVRSHEHNFILSNQAQTAALDRLAALPNPPAGAVVYLAGLPAESGPGTPIFAATWDLTGALRVQRNRLDISGIPSGALSGLVCRADGVQPEGPLFGPDALTPYSTALFVDAATGRPYRARSARDCARIADALDLPLSAT
jgi:O-antigen/teichoic acid export membrane protein